MNSLFMGLIPFFITVLTLGLGLLAVGPSWSKDLGNLLNQEMEKVQIAFEEANSEGKLSLDPLDDADHLQRALEALVVLEQEIKESEARLDKDLGILESKFEVSFKPYSMGKGGKAFLRGVKQGIEGSLVHIKEYYRIQKDFTSVQQKLLLFLQSIQGEFWEEDKVIIFTTTELMDRFNEFNSKILKLKEEENLIIEKINQR